MKLLLLEDDDLLAESLAESLKDNGRHELPVLILTARDTWTDKIVGLEGGADDYLTKPFHEGELLARLKALLRRRSGSMSQELLTNGVSLDERQPGYGLGLSILTQLMPRYSGQVRFDISSLGGLKVELTIPLKECLR